MVRKTTLIISGRRNKMATKTVVKDKKCPTCGKEIKNLYNPETDKGDGGTCDCVSKVKECYGIKGQTLDWVTESWKKFSIGFSTEKQRDAYLKTLENNPNHYRDLKKLDLIDKATIITIIEFIENEIKECEMALYVPPEDELLEREFKTELKVYKEILSKLKE